MPRSKLLSLLAAVILTLASVTGAAADQTYRLPAGLAQVWMDYEGPAAYNVKVVNKSTGYISGELAWIGSYHGGAYFPVPLDGTYSVVGAPEGAALTLTPWTVLGHDYGRAPPMNFRFKVDQALPPVHLEAGHDYRIYVNFVPDANNRKMLTTWDCFVQVFWDQGHRSRVLLDVEDAGDYGPLYFRPEASGTYYFYVQSAGRGEINIYD